MPENHATLRSGIIVYMLSPAFRDGYINDLQFRNIMYVGKDGRGGASAFLVISRVSTENRKSKIFEIFDVRKYFEPFEKNLRNFEFSRNFRRKFFEFSRKFSTKTFRFRENFVEKCTISQKFLQKLCDFDKFLKKMLNEN